MRFAMSHLRVIQGGKEPPPAEYCSIKQLQHSHELHFGPPPSLFVGTVTSLVGAFAGVVSLVLFFLMRQPDLYISQEWLMFVAAGAIVGAFMRLEQPFVSLFGQINKARPERP